MTGLRENSGVQVDDPLDLDLRITPVTAPIRAQIVEALRAAILDQRLPPAQKLVERKLCELTGASRTSVREALRQLEAEGLLHTVPYKGVYVTGVLPEQAEAIYQVREALEGLAARLCALNATAEEVEALSQAVDRFERIGRGQQQGDWIRAKDEFYVLLGQFAHNEFIPSIISSMQSKITLLRGTPSKRPERRDESVREMRRIVAAIRAHDLDDAQQASVEHVRNAAAAAVTCAV